jgi:anionic cell wall polymer biosynthesis LytR-Cps2A-Psr (LCP) family protein
MARQKCVMNAMLQQLSPQVVVTKFEKIAKASEALLTTNLPASQLGSFMQLAMKARSQPVRTVSFVPPMINTGKPDIALIQKSVKKAIAGGKASAKAKAKAGSKTAAPKAPASTQTTGGSIGNIHDGYAANQATDLSSVC